MKIKEQ